MEVPSKERQCQKLAQSSDLVVGLHGGLGEMSHSLGSQHGCYGFYPTRKHLGALGKRTRATTHSIMCCLSCQPTCRHLVSTIALMHWYTRQAGYRCFSTLLSFMSAFPGHVPCRECLPCCFLEGCVSCKDGHGAEGMAVEVVVMLILLLFFGGLCLWIWRPAAETHQCCSTLCCCCCQESLSPGCLAQGRAH